MKKTTAFAFLTALCALSAGCATKMTVQAGLSESLKEYYSIYPSVEIDIAAVTNEEAEDLKKTNADAYFSVGNPMRESLSPYTLTFFSEQTAPQTMKYNVEIWDKWLEKDPEKIAVIANMPGKSEEKGKDPRILILNMESGFLNHKKIYVEAKPGSIVRIYKEPTDPKKIAEEKKKKAEQVKNKNEKKAKETKKANAERKG